ncbi:carbohydrate ABC transporter permease [Geomicrobium sp. JCM 19039]|uniref:carbohydrate ABC transporter permease n=1 Tax=Geomicrobium sp. JCM 19039 TaxID=1460636 RepID=UPI00045F435F|nr:sugar ABC transporter permease [Geomicrobium sp. JCM 19039]GAK12737.1 N-acetyl-D-glucosamine ABC transport system, permease protein 1 [Geomicrobium sp. JCM 19039]
MRFRKRVLLFLVPAFVIYSAFMLIPLLMSMRVALYEYTGIGDMTFIGLDNFQRLLFESPYADRFINAITNTLEFFLYTMVFQNVTALLLALALTRGLKLTGLFRTIIFIPVTISILMIGFIWTLILNPNIGVLNQFLEVVRLEAWATAWLGNEATALPTVAVVNAWQYTGLMVMLFIAGIQSIPEDRFEAARLDGAKGWNIFRHIIFPAIIPIVGIVTIMTLMGVFNQFDLIYAMVGSTGGPNYAVDLLGTLFYRTAFGGVGGQVPQMGLGAAIATMTFFMISTFVIGMLYINHRRKRGEM